MDNTPPSPGAAPDAPPQSPPEHSLTVVEHALRHDRAPLLVLLILVPVLSWVWIVVMARDMYGSMSGPSAWMMTAEWDVPHVLLLWTMWSVMMAAMMLPSAWPMVRTFVGLSRRAGQLARGNAFVAAYLLVWAGFSAAATLAQWAFQRTDLVDAMLVSSSPLLTGALLAIAGLYQFSPLKRICLAHCRTPLGFLLGAWRPGTGGGFAMGARHGVVCVGCCWALMALLFVGGAMNLAWVAALSIAVALEKLLPGGERVARLLGVLLLGIGAVKLAAAAWP